MNNEIKEIVEASETLQFTKDNRLRIAVEMITNASSRGYRHITGVRLSKDQVDLFREKGYTVSGSFEDYNISW